MSETYVSLTGLKNISSILRGDETMGIGIRPFGFHAGNMASIVAYPIILCEMMRLARKEPAFDIHCWLNDIEQHAIIGHDKDPDHDDEANIYPRGTTMQFTPAPGGFEGSVVDYWGPMIQNGVLEIQRRFPNIRMSFHRTSELKSSPTFEHAVLKAIEHADTIADITQSHLNMPVHRPAEFVRAICGSCTTPVPRTEATADHLIKTDCPRCGHQAIGPVSSFDWWLMHRVLTMPKLSAVEGGFDIWMMGYDHFQERETPVREILGKLFEIKVKNYTAIHGPLILAPDGRKMGKSNGNVAYVPLDDLLDPLRHNEGPLIGIGNVNHSADIEILGDMVPAHIKRHKPAVRP